MKIKNIRQSGFTLVEIMIVVAIIGLLAAIAIPNFIQAREVTQTNACINNLRQIDQAKQQWALETGQKTSATPSDAQIAVYIGRDSTGKDIYCPLASSPHDTPFQDYTIGAVSTIPTCNNANTNTHNAVLD
jgi:prepilin-type N-terminal cleavage/methylation domain-containing protein